MKPTLGAVTIWQTSYGGFDYPTRGQVVPLLGDGVTAGGNAVLQGGALTVRQAALAFTLDDPADVATVRGYYEALDLVTYTEHDGVTTHDVYITAFSAQLRVGDIWDVSTTLVEAP